MTISDLNHKRIAIWGLGKEGLESYRYIRSHFPHKKIILINQNYPETLPHDNNIHFMLEADIKEQINMIDVVIKSPGISLYHPLVKIFDHHNIDITSATNLWFSLPRTATTIAITGSNGKSTTSSLLAHILNGMGYQTELGGNIGTPLLSLSTKAEYYVIELSSYQTADLNSAPDIAVLLNLFPEHIQWHQSHMQYYKDKTNLMRVGAKINIFNKTDPITSEIIPQIPENSLWFNDDKALHTDGEFILSDHDILGAVTNISLLGSHNYENICAALTVCAALRLDLKKCFKLAAAFSGLAHRLENLNINGSHIYINDSISTTPEATIAALKCFKGHNITVLLGGQDRQQNYSSLVQYIKKHPEINLITAYETGPIIDKVVKEAKIQNSLYTALNLQDAVSQAKKITPKGGIILLSPAAPSYDGFKNFEHRGQIFKELSQQE
ncbi:MAG: UDP-N-acetylmuramoyl-L-alanine--D-glutamate ligase [Emcibacter sp.]|nr:UDP-N-acetylmuramoyl-L-alanine--D-glutamate ligase [Emcibacter sp.]